MFIHSTGQVDQAADTKDKSFFLPMFLDQRIVRRVSGSNAVHWQTTQCLPNLYPGFSKLLVDFYPNLISGNGLTGELGTSYKQIGHLQSRSELAGDVGLIIQCIGNNNPAAGVLGPLQKEIERPAGVFINDSSFTGNGDDIILRRGIFNGHIFHRTGEKRPDPSGEGRLFVLFQYNSLSGKLHLTVLPVGETLVGQFFKKGIGKIGHVAAPLRYNKHERM